MKKKNDDVVEVLHKVISYEDSIEVRCRLKMYLGGGASASIVAFDYDLNKNVSEVGCDIDLAYSLDWSVNCFGYYLDGDGWRGSSSPSDYSLITADIPQAWVKELLDA